MKKKSNLIGDSDQSGSLHTEDDWSWEEGEEDWNGTVNREDKNKQKKRRQRMMRRKKEVDTATKARNMIGLHPISQKSVDFL